MLTLNVWRISKSLKMSRADVAHATCKVQFSGLIVTIYTRLASNCFRKAGLTTRVMFQHLGWKNPKFTRAFHDDGFRLRELRVFRAHVEQQLRQVLRGISHQQVGSVSVQRIRGSAAF